MAFGAGYLSKLTSDYKYGKYFGLKFSIEASDKFTEMELRRANKPDMFTGTLSLNHFSDMKEKKIDAMENWQLAVPSPYKTWVAMFEMSYTYSTNTNPDNGDPLYGFVSLAQGQETNNKLYACLRPDEPYFIATTAVNKNKSDWVGNIMSKNWDRICDSQTGCDANSNISDGYTINLGVPIQFGLFGSSRKVLTLRPADYIYKDDNETKLQSTIKVAPNADGLECDISLGVLFFRKYDLLMRYNSKPDGFDTQFPWNIVLSPKGSGWSWTLVAMIGGMVLGFAGCLGCICFFKKGGKGGEGEKMILEKFLGYNPRLQNDKPITSVTNEYTEVETDKSGPEL